MSPKRKRRSPRGPGWTISQFAALPEIDSTPAAIRKAVENKLIAALDWNGVKRIPPRAKDEYLATWGTPVSAPAE